MNYELKKTPPIVICGSAAAEGIPAFFCNCAVCTNARARRGKDIRHRTTYLFGDEIMIDFGPDVYHAQTLHPIDKVKYVLLTHAHNDHLLADQIPLRHPSFSRLSPGDVLTFVGSAASLDIAKNKSVNDGHFPADMIAFNPVEPYREIALPDADARVVALKANHAPQLDPYIYIVTCRDRTVLFGNDTGYFPEETWAYLEQHAPRLDVAILDCTGANQNWRDGHMGGDTILEVFTRLREIGCVTDATTKVVNHFSHNGNMNHDDLCALFNPYNIAVGYDGMTL